MQSNHSSRREFLTQSGSMAAGGWLSLTLPLICATAQTACSKREQEAGFTNLERLEAIDMEASAAQILPSDDTPGATEAGVIIRCPRCRSSRLGYCWREAPSSAVCIRKLRLWPYYRSHSMDAPRACTAVFAWHLGVR